MDTKLITIQAGEKEAVININTADNAIASLATNSIITGDSNVKILTWWPILNDWFPILSAKLTDAKMPLQKGYCSVFVPNIDLRGETQIKIQFAEVQLNEVKIEIKFCNI